MPFVEIHIKGKIDDSWSDWFAGMEIQQISPDETLFSGELDDQSAIYGVISRLSSLGLALISVQCKENET